MDEEIDRQLHARGLARVSGALLSAALPSLRLTTRAVRETALPIGAYECARVLPPSGLLFFFYETETPDDDEQDAANPLDARPGCSVLYCEGDPSQLARRRAPRSLQEWDRFTACAVAFVPIVTLPAPEAATVASLGLIRQEHDAYLQFYLGLTGDYYDRGRTPEHRLLGHPYNLEGDPRVACLVASRGRAWAETSGLDEAGLGREAADWMLLLQLDSDASADMDWNGGGIIYFCLPRKALQARDFSPLWATSQFF
jgi:hypothetical protein